MPMTRQPGRRVKRRQAYYDVVAGVENKRIERHYYNTAAAGVYRPFLPDHTANHIPSLSTLTLTENRLIIFYNVCSRSH